MNKSKHKSYYSNHNIGFISTRFSGNDGVSLETTKWAHVLEYLGNTCFYFAGEFEKVNDYSMLVPLASFKHPEINSIHDILFNNQMRPPEISISIDKLKQYLKEQIYIFVRKFDINVLIIENALTIPVNIPLGLAITEFLSETRMMAIAHHHDFFWERKRFLANCAWDYLNMSFPPRLPTIYHVVINSSGANQLALRTGASSMLIPNVMDFDHPPQSPGDYIENMRSDLGINQDEYFFLQPTRVVQRKGIEHAIELIRRIERKAKLIISHASGDEGYDYEMRIKYFAELCEVPLICVSDMIGTNRSISKNGNKIYSLNDAYHESDFVTYPSTIEGFGNAFLEAIYFKKPLLINNYSIYSYDIRPKGFRVIEFDGYISQDTVKQVINVLDHPEIVEEWSEHNYRLAKKYFSYSVLERELRTIFLQSLGDISLM